MSNLPTRKFRLRAVVLAACLFVTTIAFGDEGGKPASVRPEIGKPLQAAVEFLKAKKGKEALAKIQEADAVGGKTPQETYLIDRMRGQAAASAGDAATAAHSLEAAATSAMASPAERPALLAGAAGQYYLTKSYAKSSELLRRYLKEGGNDPALRMLLVQSLYLGGELSGAADEMAQVLKDQEAAGKAATEEELQLYSTICLKRGDNTCYASALEKLLTRYPKQDYWLTAIYEITKIPGFSSRHALNVARLKLFTNTMRTAGEYFEAAQLSMQEGFPVEAKQIIERGYAAGLLGSGSEADRHRRLRDMVERAVAEDNRTLGADDATANGAANGIALVNSGFNYVLRRQADKGLAMIEKGIGKGGFKHPDDAQMKLGIAQALSAHGSQAAQTFSGVHGKDGIAELARLWAIASRRS